MDRESYQSLWLNSPVSIIYRAYILYKATYGSVLTLNGMIYTHMSLVMKIFAEFNFYYVIFLLVVSLVLGLGGTGGGKSLADANSEDEVFNEASVPSGGWSLCGDWYLGDLAFPCLRGWRFDVRT